MANFRTTITTNSTTAICTITKPRALTEWFATLNAFGTFGGGTLAYSISTDGGTTKVPMKDMSGTLYTTTANDAVNVATGVSNHNGFDPIIYAVLSGATTPSITVDVLDNR